MKKQLILTLIALLSVFSARAYDFKVDGIYYNYVSGTTDAVAVTYGASNKSYSGSVVIPATVTYEGVTYRVTAIGWNAFRNEYGLTSVTIPEGVTSIGDEAFYNCNGLTSLTIPESVTTIGDEAFYDCRGLTSLTLPESVTAIGGLAFGGTAISSPLYNSKVFAYMPTDYSGAYEIPDGIRSIADDAFGECSGLTSVTIPNSVTSIGGFAFCKCSGLTSVTIPESVTSIGNWAFENCRGLTSVTIREGVTSIGRGAFGYCFDLTLVTLPESVTTIGDWAFGGTAISSPLYNSKVFAYMPRDYSGAYEIPDGIQSIAGSAFGGCDGLTSVTIPESVTSIGNYAFDECPGLRSVTLPEGVTTIGNGAFYGTSIGSPLYNSKVFAYMPMDYSGAYEIPDGIQSIAGGAFEYCIGLTSVTLPESLDTIGMYAFYGCSRLVKVYSLAKNPPYCVEDLDYDRPTFEVYGTLYVPRGCVAAYALAPEWCEFAAIEEITTARVTLRANDVSMGVVIGGGVYDLDAQVALVAIPNEGYHFVKWDDGNTDNPRILTVEGDITLTAIFAKNPDAPVYYTVTLRVNDAAMGSVLGGGQYARDDQATLVAIPNLGYHFVRWDDGNTANPRTLTVTGDITLTAIFAKNDPTANEAALSAAPFAYVQGRTAYLSDGLGEVEALTATGQRVYRGFDRSIALPRPGVYILRVVADGRRCKVIVR